MRDTWTPTRILIAPEKTSMARIAPLDEASFMQAARRGDGAAVVGAIAANPELVKAKEATNGWTVLHMFARMSLVQPVQHLLALGAAVDARDGIFRSPLLLAAAADAQPAPTGSATNPKEPATIVNTMRTLLKAGARVTARDNFGMTALHHAARAGHDAAVLFLLHLNTEMSLPRAPIEAETNAEERPLHLAAGVRCAIGPWNSHICF